MSDECLFCKIIAGEIPSNKVYSDQELYAFHDITPAAPTHILVIPRKHISAISQAGSDDEAMLGNLMRRAALIAADQGLLPGGYRLVINTGDDGGQSVHHLHLHIIGGRRMTWPPG